MLAAAFRDLGARDPHRKLGQLTEVMHVQISALLSFQFHSATLGLHYEFREASKSYTPRKPKDLKSLNKHFKIQIQPYQKTLKP